MTHPTCRVCSRDLTRPESRDAGIGPVCAAREGCAPPARVRIFDPAPRARRTDPRQVTLDDASLHLWGTALAVQLALPLR